MESNIIFPRIFNDIPFNTILYSILRLNRNIISYFFLRSAYSPRRAVPLCARVNPTTRRRDKKVLGKKKKEPGWVSS